MVCTEVRFKAKVIIGFLSLLAASRLAFTHSEKNDKKNFLDHGNFPPSYAPKLR